MDNQNIQNNKLQLLGKLSASIVHEIRNPLSAIQLNLEYINLLNEKLSNEVKESLDGCLEGSKRIQMIIENTLEFSRSAMEENRVQSLNSVVEIAIELMDSTANRSKVILKKELGENLPNLLFNKSKLLQVLINLITNSIEAIQYDGKIILKTYIEESIFGKSVVVEVKDNGCGIPEEVKEKIFTDFYTNKKGGTGLGLSVCRSIINEFNGTFSFTSEYGKGTSFYIKFNENNKPEENGK